MLDVLLSPEVLAPLAAFLAAVGWLAWELHRAPVEEWPGQYGPREDEPPPDAQNFGHENR